MKKIILNLGIHNGYYQVVKGKYGTPSYKKEDENWFVANRRTIEYVEFCGFVETQI